jgi:translation initiation factor IF-2
MYQVLLKEFQGDKNAKDEAKQIVIGKIRRDEPTSGTTSAASESISSRKSDSVENEEILIKNVAAPIEEKVAAEPKQEEVEEKHAASNHLKVVGKIDLDSIGKGKSKKADAEKEAETVEKKVPNAVVEKEEKPAKPVEAEVAPVEEKVPEKVTQPEEKPAPSAPKEEKVKVVEEKKTETPPAAAAPKKEEKPAAPATPAAPTENIPTRYAKLEGPKVIGKIELPKPKEKPVASSSGANQDNKRKRKRTNKPGTPVPPNAQAGQQRPGQGGGRTDNRHPGNRQQGRGRHDARGKGRQDAPKEELSEKEIQDQIKATLARLSGAGKSGKFAQRAKLRRQKRDDIALSAEEAALEQEMMAKVLRVTEFVTANELANLMDVPVTQVIATCMSLGMFVSINQRLDAETLTIVADEFGYQIEFIKPDDEEVAELEEPDNEASLVSRAPIVTVMGHVDHGKTSLLDYIRKANVTKGEAGGITQHIGAYAVQLDDGRRMTFLDTPGHEAFTAMRARGAKVTDIVIIVIAADDAVMPQTKEAINHAQAAGSPIVFAFTKVDKPGANPDRIREQLSAMNILVEEWGGKYQAQEISAKTGENVDLLLEKVLLEAEILELKADPTKRAVGSVIEAALDKGRGIVTTVLVQGGTLRIGDAILAGSYSGKVKALTNERGERVKEAGPSIPVQILGMTGAPTAGDKLYVLESESEARQVASKRLQLQREQGMRATKHITLDEIGRRLAIGNFKELNIIVKGDVDGSIEALSDSLLKLSTDEIQVNVIHKSVGAISESDVLLASASDALIIGFQVRPTQGARKLAENEQIDIRLYSIIYDAIEELKSAMEGMLAPKFEEKIVAEVQIRETFKISKVGTIAGCMVLEGKINRNNDIRVIREGVVIHTGKLASLKRFKDDVKEVAQGYECGLNIDRFNDIEVGDIVEAYEQVEVKRKL